MPQIKKDFKMLNVKLDKGISDDLEAYSSSTGLSKTAVVEKALKAYIEQSHKSEKP